mgnify:CR=1 FL=1
MALTYVPVSMTNYLLDLCIQAMLKNSNELTTLELKEYFRNNYGNIYMDQSMVSNYLNENYTNYNLSFTDNGTYREYYINTKLNDKRYYISESKGLVKISDMHSNHLINALVKEINVRTNLSKSFIKNLLLELKENESELAALFNEFLERDDDN